MNKFFTVSRYSMTILVLSLTYFFMLSCESDAGTAKLPSINIEPLNISFEGLTIGDNSASKILEIKNTGEGDLELSKIFLNSSSEGELDYYIDNISNTSYAQVVYPIVLKKNEIAKIKIGAKPTDEGIKTTTLQIETNLTENSTRLVPITADDFFPELQVNEARSNGGDFENIRDNVKNLTIKKCTNENQPFVNSSTLINICNIGKSVLKINSIDLEGDAISIEYFKIEQVNTPSRIPETMFPDAIKHCITGLAICHNGDSGLEANLRITNTSYNSPDEVIRLIAE